MKLRSQWVLVLTLITLVFSGCKSNTSEDAAVPAIGEVEPNATVNECPDNGKENLLDTALKMSGKKLSADERGLVMRMLSLNETDLLRGLGVFLEISGGRYPSNLDAKTILPQAEALWKAKYGETAADRKQITEKAKEGEEKIHDIFFASAYYGKLVREKKDVAYYGDKVTVEDSGKVLMRWKISEGRYRVIFGDLTTENISAERLAELEGWP